MSVSHANPVTQAGFTQIPNVIMLDPSLSPTAKLIYGYLKHLAWRNGSEDETDPPQAVVAKDLGLSENTVRTAMKALCEADLLRSTRRGLGKPNHYEVLDPQSATSESEVQETLDLPDLARARSSSEVKTEKLREERSLVLVAWLESPGMIKHQPRILLQEDVQRKIDKAISRYSLEEVVAAIGNYATVASTPTMYWWPQGQRWTLPDFLTRGLDRFVPEAEPLKVYKSSAQAKLAGDGQKPHYARESAPGWDEDDDDPRVHVIR